MQTIKNVLVVLLIISCVTGGHILGALTGVAVIKTIEKYRANEK